MNTIGSIVRPLLKALRNAGGEVEADLLTREYDARDWKLEVSDQLKLMARLQALLEAPPLPKRPTREELTTEVAVQPALPPLAHVPERFSVFAGLAPWVESLPGKWSFVDAVHALIDARSYPALIEAVRRVFVDDLGFQASNLDETHRVQTQQTISRVRAVAQHDDFFVVVIESKYAGPHLSSFEPVFQLHPRAIIFALECGERIRVVARRVDSGQSQLIGQRVVRGRGRRSFPDDDLFVWCGRMSQLEPQVGDDGRGVAKRADQAVRRTSREIVEAWPTASLLAQNIPGQPWERSIDEELERFFQSVGEERLVFGLEAEFRSSFPWTSRDGTVSLRYDGYTVSGMGRNAWAAEARGQTLEAELTLSLELIHDGQDPEKVTVACVVSVPDERGVFVLRGDAHAFCPRLGVGVGQADDEAFVEEDEELELELELDEHPEGGDVAAEPEPTIDLEKDPPADVYDNEGLTPLLRWVVGRKLRMLGANFANTPVARLETANAVRAWLGRYADPQERLQLVARSTLWTYLRQPHASLRAIGVDPALPPPAWACLELAPHLEPGQMLPVAGSRLGPGGVIAAVVPDGKGALCLTASEHEHPRLRDSGSQAEKQLWVSPSLEAFSAVAAGRVSRPLDVAGGGVPLRLRTFVPAEAPVALALHAASLPRRRATRRWTFDVPRHLDATEPMTLEVGAGQTVREGDLLAHVASGWVDSKFERHDLVRVGMAIRNRSTKDAESRRSRIEVRCPPALAGLIESIEVVTIHDLRGRPVRERLALVVSRRVSFSDAVLPDGRTIRLRDVSAGDLPFDAEDGTRADAALLPDGGLAAADVAGETSWKCGLTGEPVQGTPDVLEVWLLPRPEPRLPDPCLPARALDSWGVPRSAHDPQLTVGALRRLLVAQPPQAGALLGRLQSWTGSPWATTSLFDLSRACHLPPPPTVPADWLLDEEEGAAEAYDPLRTRLHKEAGAPYRVDMGPWAWSCDCGLLCAARYAQIPCAECGSTVKRRWIGLPNRRQPLPLPILHPWRIELTAALLGLTGEELEQLARTEDCSALYAATEAALEEPTRSLARRLVDADAWIAVELQRQLQLVEDALLRGLRLEELWIRELTLLSPRLLFDGYRTGAPDLTASPLTARYRKIEGLSGFGAAEPGTPMRRATWVELQKAVSELFGEAVGTPESGTLASLWSRLWPTTCEPNVPIAVPGLFESCEGRDLHASLVAKLMRSEGKSDEPRRVLGLLGTDGVESLNVPSLPPLDVTDPDAWKERAALSECWGPRLPFLAAVCLGVDEKPSIVAGLRGMDGAAELQGAGSLGMVVLRELFRLLASPGGRPSALLQLLAASPPLALPRAREDALARLDERLLLALPGEQFAPRLVREALARVLGGFWAGTPTRQHPDRWVWTQLADSAPPGFRRTVPNLASSAWLVWPGIKMLCAPILAALQGWESGRTAGHAAGLGLETPELPEALSIEARPDPTVSAPHEMGEPIAPAELPGVEGAEHDVPEPEAAPEALLRVLPVSLDLWMKQQRRNDAHVE